VLTGGLFNLVLPPPPPLLPRLPVPPLLPNPIFGSEELEDELEELEDELEELAISSSVMV